MNARLKSWSLRLLIVFGALAWVTVVGVTWSRADQTGQSDQDALSKDARFSWLDPEKKIYVLQNRKYTKAHRLMITVNGTTGVSDAYRTTAGIDPRVGFYFTEWFGIEAFYRYRWHFENSTFGALQATNTPVVPVVRELQQEIGGLLHFTPWYAKINVFNQMIYFDWYFTAGAGMINARLDSRANVSAAPTYTAESLMGVFLGTGHLYHFSELFSARLDFMGTLYPAKAFGDSGDLVWFSSLGFSFGLGVRL